MVPARPCVDDWRDSDTYYRSACSLTDRGWAWEFLRRNPDYRAQSSSVKLLDHADDDRKPAIVERCQNTATAAPWGLICFRGFASRCEVCQRLLAIDGLSVGPSCHRVAVGWSELCRTATACRT